MNIPGFKDFYDSKDAILLTAMSYQTYPLYEKETLVLPKGFENRYTIRAIAGGSDETTKVVFGFVAESEDRIVLAFRGSDSTLDLVSDLDLFQIPYPYVENAGKTHRGITKVYQSTRDDLIKELSKYSASKKLLVTGHSLGADLAILASLDIAVNTEFKNPIVYTLAAGRVGDPAFVSLFNEKVKNSVRIYNVHDMIPTLPAEEYPAPFTEDGLSYRHVSADYPVSFQLDNMFYNHKINCYFGTLSKENPEYAKALHDENPGFCPDTDVCCCLSQEPGSK